MLKNSSGFRSSIKAFGKHKRMQQGDLKHEVMLLRNGNENARERIILGHLGLAGSVAARYAYVVYRDPNDIMGVAMLALVDAVDRMANGACKHENYGAYIHKCVNGRISNYLSQDFLIKPPNGSPDYERLKNAGLGMRPNDYASLDHDESGGKIFGSDGMGRYSKGSNPILPKTMPPSTIVEDLFESTSFTTRERILLKLSYEGYTDGEIAKELGFSTSRVQQIRAGLLDLVKAWLKR